MSTGARQNPEAEKKRANEIADFQFVMGDARGRRVIRRVIEQAGVFQSSFAGEASHTTAFKEGARNLGLELLNEIMTICPEKWQSTLKGE